MRLWEKTMQILDNGEALLIKSEDVYSLQALTSITKLVSELQVSGYLEEKSGISKNCIKYAPVACNLIFQEIQTRLDALIDNGYKDFRELAKTVEE